MASRPFLPVRANPSKIGRPTKNEALTRQVELLDSAVDLFLELGYDDATMELIASSVGMTKRTIYSRHEDKAALFKATVQRAIETMTATQAETLRSLENEELEVVLAEVARMRIRQLTSPVGIKLQRIVSAETRRFPEIFLAVSRQVTEPVVTFLGDILSRYASAGNIITSNPDMAATAFLSMAVGAPARIAASGNKVDEIAVEDRITFTVELFLNGLRPR